MATFQKSIEERLVELNHALLKIANISVYRSKSQIVVLLTCSLHWYPARKRLKNSKNMISNETTLKMLKYCDKSPAVIDNNDELTRGDLQRSIEAIVLSILNKKQK